MNKALIIRLTNALFHMKRAGAMLSVRQDVSIVELGAMRRLYDNRLDSDTNVFAQDLTEELHTSKAAVSQMLGSLEHRGYLRRDFNPINRRKIILTLTDKGRQTVDCAEREMMERFSAVIEDFGEENARLLVELFERLSETFDRHVQAKVKNGDTP